MMKFGFHAVREDENEERELEKLLGAKFLAKDREPYCAHLGQYVNVHVGGGVVQGLYQGLTENGHIILLPSVQSEKYPTDQTFKEIITKFYWETSRPDMIKFEAVGGMSPVRKEYLDWVIQNVGRDFPDLKSSTQQPVQ